ncbi:transcriptional regulator [Candidatus Gottesmanbacteria bacterium RIFCSPHIGHO2_02_FULL_39_14]|uniref:Transcriptional regulator n=1 Tax=Candidatus Gottesmanbacteria bacterium RIFCSPHIGHO2_02_FULL_39_14 TaxID=1798383 RepID=A0A1F5ZWR7_9BACT|nr:MAG: transcriptional regulator [Candidatus Gottesmanbacteria bacterium RIFCSPHIGHO2_02_FULL_39_14]
MVNSIRKARRQKKLTQEKLADKIGVTRQTIIALEKGNYTPSVMLALKISKFFKVKVEDLFKIKR